MSSAGCVCSLSVLRLNVALQHYLTLKWHWIDQSLSLYSRQYMLKLSRCVWYVTKKTSTVLEDTPASTYKDIIDISCYPLQHCYINFLVEFWSLIQIIHAFQPFESAEKFRRWDTLLLALGLWNPNQSSLPALSVSLVASKLLKPWVCAGRDTSPSWSWACGRIHFVVSTYCNSGNNALQSVLPHHLCYVLINRGSFNHEVLLSTATPVKQVPSCIPDES